MILHRGGWFKYPPFIGPATGVDRATCLARLSSLGWVRRYHQRRFARVAQLVRAGAL